MKVFYPIVVGVIVSCGNSNDIRVNIQGLDSGTLTVRDISDSSVIHEFTIENGNSFLDSTEIAAGLRPLLFDIEGTFNSAVSKNDQHSNLVQVNAITSLSVCRLTSLRDIRDSSLESQNELFSRQFQVSNIIGANVKTNYVGFKELKEPERYGILLGAFENLSQSLNMRSQSLVRALCDDVEYDSVFNGVGKKGKISGISDQTLKLRLAEAIDQFAQKNLKNVPRDQIIALANSISISKEPGLFPESTVNYSFDH